MDPIIEAIVTGASASVVVGAFLLFVGHRFLERAVDARFLHLAETLREDTEVRLEQLRSELRTRESDHMVRKAAEASTAAVARTLLTSLCACSAAFQRAEQWDSPERRQSALDAALDYEAKLQQDRALVPQNLLALFDRGHVALYDWSLHFSPTLRVPKPPRSDDPAFAATGRAEVSHIMETLHRFLSERALATDTHFPSEELRAPAPHIRLKP